MSTKKSLRVLIFTVMQFLFQISLQAQNISASTIKTIETQISNALNKNIKAGENLNIKKVKNSTNDSLKCGFIDNGNYYASFEQVMFNFKRNIQGIESQKMTVVNKKITVLSINKALLTASGNYVVKITNGRILKGKFAWSFVYSKINGVWKVIHSHMSNP